MAAPTPAKTPYQVSFSGLILASTLAAGVASRTTSLDTFTALLWTYAVAIPAWVLYKSYIYPFYVSPLRVVPTVPGFPLWGQFLEIITEEVGVPQRRWHKELGPVVRYFFPLGAERLSIADDNALKHMMVKNPYNFPKPVRAKKWMLRILGEGVLLAEGGAHVHQRKALTPGFSIASIRTLAPIFWRKAILMADLWEQEMNVAKAKTRSFEVLEWLNRTTLDIIGEAGFGTDINSLEHPETPLREAYRAVFVFDLGSRILHGLQAFFPMTKYLPAKMNRDMEFSRQIILGNATNIIKEKQSSVNPADKDILSLLVRDNMKLQAAGEKGLTFETMRDQVMTFLGAGHDTTATGVAWTLHLLTKYQDVQNKLREEIRAHYPFLFDDATRHDPELFKKIDPDQLPYMDNVCRESLRYIPPIPMTVRQSLADDKLGDYFVPGGTTVYVLANTINRMPEYWGPTANTFDPDRWDHLPESYTTNAFMTFLQGPRGCIGRKFAETEMKTLLCSLLSKFHFERDESVTDPEDLKMWRLVLRPRDGVTLKASKI
ncbi:cytochrome P450, putative [Paecilomyces variotii No. 5]|uniref:Cytochrome P450, putative n=1 Tax=Byssochlamys spectabilis (strain No. 5 / NBRC 109023) TaxID=1356009 RepID=V5G324_BYSSN|nr:cytochrome P450, putative [Paecilomyces variotii No. 5]